VKKKEAASRFGMIVKVVVIKEEMATLGGSEEMGKREERV
jgi:hypothetical protein